MAAYLTPQHPNLTDARISSASTEEGVTVQAPTENSVSGNIRLRASGEPTASTTMRIKLRAGGNPEGFDENNNGSQSGATAMWRISTDGDDDLRGWNHRAFTVYSDSPTTSSNVQYGWPSTVRQLGNGSAGFACYESTGTDTILFYHKASRRADWTEVLVFTDGDDGLTLDEVDQRVGLIVFNSGRIVLYLYTSAPITNAVSAYFSDDHGATWSLYRSLCFKKSDGGHDIISAETVDGDVVLFTGDKNAAGIATYFSASAGTTFAEVGTGNGTYYRPTSTVLANGQILLMADDNANQVTTIVLGIGGDIDLDANWTDQFTATAADGARSQCVVTDDDGTLWHYMVSDPTAGEYDVHVNSDNAGAASTWVIGTPDSGSMAIRLVDSASSTIDVYQAGLAGGWAFGDIITVGSSVAPTASDGDLHAIYWGGWNDRVNEKPAAVDVGDVYNIVSYFPVEKPDLMRWTKTDTGAGSTTTLANGYLNIVGTGSDNSFYSIHSSALADLEAGAGQRGRFVFDAQTAGDTTDNRAVLMVAISTGGGNVQQFFLRFGSGFLAVYDNSGQLAAASADFSVPTEVVWGFVKDTGAGANTGLMSLWYRRQGVTLMTRMLDNQDVSEVAGTSGAGFGGLGAGAITWNCRFFCLGIDDAGWSDWTDQTDLLGRPLDAAVDLFFNAGVYIGAYGIGGVDGDTWDFTTAHTYEAEHIVRSASPSRHWRSTGDSQADNIVLDAGANNLWKGNFWSVFGTNFKDMAIEFNATDAWGAPSVTLNLSSVVNSGTVASAAKGFVTVSGVTLIQNAYKSQEGRRYYVHFSGDSTVYEITNNTTDTIEVQDTDLTGKSGTASILGDGMWDATAQTTGYRYMRLSITSQDTHEGYYRIGRLQIGTRLELDQTVGTMWANGHRTQLATNVTLIEGDSSRFFTQRRGPPTKRLTLQFDAMPRTHVNIDQKIESLYRALGGSKEPVAIVRGSSTAHFDENGGLYTVSNDTLNRSNLFGEGLGQILRVDAISFREVP